jgi:hypothetical protein
MMTKGLPSGEKRSASLRNLLNAFVSIGRVQESATWFCDVHPT